MTRDNIADLSSAMTMANPYDKGLRDLIVSQKEREIRSIEIDIDFNQVRIARLRKEIADLTPSNST
jgi:hypothetical protein